LGVWNEPNLGNLSDPFVYGCGLVGCDAPPQSYGRLFVATIAARNASAAPSFPLAGPETSHRALLTGYYASAMAYVNQNGGFAAQDVVTVHYYPDASIDVLSYMDQVHAAEPNNPAWLSETGQNGPYYDDYSQSSWYYNITNAFLRTGRPWWSHLIFFR